MDEETVNNSLTTLKTPGAVKGEVARQEQWDELRSVFPIYLALARQLDLEIPFGPDRRNLPAKASPELLSEVQTWLNSMDQRVLVHQLRHLLQMTTLNASESGLRCLILRHLRKTAKNNTDRDKIDFLLVQYFALCAPPKIYHRHIELLDAAQVMRPVLGEADATPLAWCEPLEKMIESLRGFRSLRDILKTNFIEQGRRVKESAGGMFYDPSSLVAFIRFNFLVRRTLIELMHADLIAIRAGLTHIDNAGIKSVSCVAYGLSASEPIGAIRQIADDWKQPFQKEYNERSVNQVFEKLLALRADVEKAVEKTLGKPLENSKPREATENAATSREPAETGRPAARNGEKAPAVDSNPGAGTALDFETCMEQVWEQLISAPPSRGRSMTTVRIAGARLLMSSWEVAAFVSEDGPAAEDLRRAVVARALVSSALEYAKESGNATSLDRALSIARVEVTRLQERVEVAKQTKDTEAAVNLGISTKRLLSALDEAEKL